MVGEEGFGLDAKTCDGQEREKWKERAGEAASQSGTKAAAHEKAPRRNEPELMKNDSFPGAELAATIEAIQKTDEAARADPSNML
jgi:hypothetical protein